jgi:hypothetical protein
MNLFSRHVSSDRLGDAAQAGNLDGLHETERIHIVRCESCRRLLAGYRLTDRLLAAPWREVRVPATARAAGLAAGAAPLTPRLALAARLGGGLRPRSMAPVAAVVAVLLMFGAAVALPALIPPAPAASHTPIASRTGEPKSPAATATAEPSGGHADRTSGAQGGDGTDSPSPAAGGPTSTPSGAAGLGLVRTGGSPIAWSPDGEHLLLWGAGPGHQLQIRDALGRLTGSVAADAAAWVTSSTIAVSVRGSSGPGGSPASPTPADTGGHGGSGGRSGGSGGYGGYGGYGGFGGFGGGPGGYPGASPSPGSSSAGWGNGSGARETIRLIDVSGDVVGTVPGVVAPDARTNVMLLGSGSGELAITAADRFNRPTFWVWNGTLSAGHAGLPIAFSADGSRLAVLNASAANGPGATGTLEITSVPALSTIAGFGRLVLHVGSGSLGSAYGFDAAFSPNGASLLVSGTLVNLATGGTLQVGRGGWLPDGTLVTASNGGLVRWSGGHATLDSRFSGAGTVETSRHGELIYFYADSRPPLLLDTDGSVRALSLAGVRSIGNLLISPDGRSIALTGRAGDGSSIGGVATLP